MSARLEQVTPPPVLLAVAQTPVTGIWPGLHRSAQQVRPISVSSAAGVSRRPTIRCRSAMQGSQLALLGSLFLKAKWQIAKRLPDYLADLHVRGPVAAVGRNVRIVA